MLADVCTLQLRGHRCDTANLGASHCEQALVDAIEATIPQARGQRHDLVFVFCRHLRGIPEIVGVDVRSLRAIAKLWHEQAYPIIGTKPFEATWGDFLTAFRTVKFPIGEGPVAELLATADRSDPPVCARDYESNAMIRLVKLCRELQRVAKDSPFYLSCRTAGRLLGIDHTTAWKLLCVLVTDCVLSVAKDGMKTDAARYFYLRTQDRDFRAD